MSLSIEHNYAGRQRGGAVRGYCRNLGHGLDRTILALVPSTNQKTPLIEQTISDRPTFWFYVPSLPVSQLKAEFVLPHKNNVYLTILGKDCGMKHSLI